MQSIVTQNSKQTELIELLEKEVVLLNTMFKDLDHIVKQQGEQLNTLEDSIIASKQDITTANKDIEVANDFSTGLSKIRNSIVGISLGGLLYLYNPHIAIGTMLIGGYIYWTVGDTSNNPQI